STVFSSSVPSSSAPASSTSSEEEWEWCEDEEEETSSVFSSSVAPSSSSMIISSSIASSSAASSSIISSSVSSAPPAESSLPPPSPPNCFEVTGVSQGTFNPQGAQFKLEYICPVGLNPDTYSIYSNWAPVTGTTVEGNSITLGNLPGGLNLVTIFAFDTDGKALVQTIPLVFGDKSVQVIARDPSGNLFPGATVTLTSVFAVGYSATVTTDGNGLAVFNNINPSTPYHIQVTGPDGSVGDGTIVAFEGSREVRTRSIPPIDAANDNFGMTGFDGPGWYQGDGTRKVGSGDGTQASQNTGKTVTIPGGRTGTTSFFMEYQFYSSEILSTETFTDPFTITMRTDAGQLEWFTSNSWGLGADAFDGQAAGWFTKELHVPAESDATLVRFDAAVANMWDDIVEGFVTVRNIGMCDKCATCAECPGLAKCQDKCITPRKRTCAFYKTCAEESLKCGPEGYLLAQAEKTCETLRHVVRKGGVSQAANEFIDNAEQCVQTSIAGHLNCGTTCTNLAVVAMKAQGTCYVDNGFCSLSGIEAAHLLAILGHDQRHYVGQAVAAKDGCLDTLLTKITAEREDPNVSASNAWALYAAETYLESFATPTLPNEPELS
ncbi:hypothetical protein QBC34DRAFT_476037, partial [Podospora aff. communis PSN243]